VDPSGRAIRPQTDKRYAGITDVYTAQMKPVIGRSVVAPDVGSSHPWGSP